MVCSNRSCRNEHLAASCQQPATDGVASQGVVGIAAFVVFSITVVTVEFGLATEQSGDHREFVCVSPRDSRYFELTNGRPYIPVGFNLVGPPPADDLERVVNKMADHGVNYCRIWLDQPLWSVEHARSGNYDTEKAKQLDRFLDLCRPRGIRVGTKGRAPP